MALDCYPWQVELRACLEAVRENLPNAVLIYGPRGIGTVDFVIEFVKSLVCENPAPDGSPCGTCAGCALARAYTHPDIAYVLTEPEALIRHIPFTEPDTAKKDRKLYREILIHQIRALTDFLNLTTHRATGRRAVVIYPADVLRADSASALLKNLEEPPKDTTFFLVADDLDKVLPTIRSRSRLLRVKPPAEDEAIHFLSMQGISHPKDALRKKGGQPLTVIYERLVEEDDDMDKKVKAELLSLGTLSES
ncbi:MAG TPA: DNA polymerase III subunit delta, partial [Sutterella sp.]|nr:DNA polymerase III subunit delta [Sutterella sp.]